MATKHVNAGKDASFQSSRGRSAGQTPKASSSSSGGRERNVGHGNAEEHSRVSKGNQGGQPKSPGR
jgi:hypothetical protein